MLGSADELLAQVIEKDLQGMAPSAELTRVLMGLRLHGKNSLAVWLLEFFLAQRGFSLKGIYNMQHDMSNLSSTERLALRSLLFEFTINAFYSTPMYKALGFLISDMLLFDRHVDAGTKAFLSSNIVHFVPILAFERFFSINTDMPFITPATGLRYKPSNPSVLQTADGYLILIRGVNCAHDGRSWWSLADDGVFRSRYIVLLADRELNVLARHELTLAHVKRPVLSRQRPNEGVEDARLVMLDGQVWFTASAYDQSEHGTIRIVLCRLALAPDAAGELPVLSWTALDGPDPLRAEKNWLPFVHEGALHAFYSLGPETIALRLHADSGTAAELFLLAIYPHTTQGNSIRFAAAHPPSICRASGAQPGRCRLRWAGSPACCVLCTRSRLTQASDASTRTALCGWTTPGPCGGSRTYSTLTASAWSTAAAWPPRTTPPSFC
jgi:hypothetical protein